MAALILPSRRVFQPQGPVTVDPRFGLQPIGLYLPPLGRHDAYDFKPFSGGSALNIRVGAAGVSAIQNAVNTGLYRAVPSVRSVDEYTAIWHGVPLGTPVGSTPAFVGIANSTTTQSSSLIAIEYIDASTLHAIFKTANLSGSRTGAFTWANAFNKLTTLIAKYSTVTATVKLGVVSGGIYTQVVDTTFSGGGPPTILGTEQFIVGGDVIELPSRHVNAQTAFAGVFYGHLSDAYFEEVGRNPWQLFQPIQRRIWVSAASSGPTIQEADLNSAGSGAVSLAAGSRAATTLSAPGAGAASLAGSATSQADLASAGAATPSLTSATVTATAFAFAGAGAISFSAAQITLATLQSAGTSTTGFEGEEAGPSEPIEDSAELLGMEVLGFEVLSEYAGPAYSEADMVFSGAAVVSLGAAMVIPTSTQIQAQVALNLGAAMVRPTTYFIPCTSPSTLRAGSFYQTQAAIAAGATVIPRAAQVIPTQSAIGGTVALSLITEALKEAGMSITAGASVALDSGKVAGAILAAPGSTQVVFPSARVMPAHFDSPAAALALIDTVAIVGLIPISVEDMVRTPEQRKMRLMPDNRAMSVPAISPMQVAAENRRMERA